MLATMKSLLKVGEEPAHERPCNFVRHREATESPVERPVGVVRMVGLVCLSGLCAWDLIPKFDGEGVLLRVKDDEGRDE